MRYIVDQTSLRVAKDLKRNGYESVTATELARGHQDSRERASDFKILSYLKEHREDHILLTADIGLAKDCHEERLPCVLLPNPLPPFAEILRLLAAGPPEI